MSFGPRVADSPEPALKRGVVFRARVTGSRGRRAALTMIKTAEAKDAALEEKQDCLTITPATAAAKFHDQRDILRPLLR